MDASKQRPAARVGVIGTGFIARGAMNVIAKDPELDVARVLTRRPLESVTGVARHLLTRSIDELLDSCELVFEASGDPLHATVVIEKALEAGKRVVTMNSELHVTTGSWFVGRGYLTEAEGDQPGATALLKADAEAMGFRPLAYVNIKGFLDPDPTLEAMQYWSARQGLSLAETISFTDGTKVQIEQALCANAFGAELIRDGLTGAKVSDITQTDYLVDAARALGQPVSDFVIAPGAPPGVFVLAEHDVSTTLPHYGPYEKLFTAGRRAYLLLRPYHLCALEVVKSLRKARDGAPPMLTNGAVPRASVAAVAKRELAAGTVITHAIGSFDVRGEAVVAGAHPDHVPLGLLEGARIRTRVERGQRLGLSDVEIPPSRALAIWRELRARMAATPAAALPHAPRPPSVLGPLPATKPPPLMG